MDWCRLWNDMPTDPKWRTIGRKAGQPVHVVIAVYVAILANASAASPRGTLEGWDDEDIGAAIDLDPEAILAIRNAMQGKVLDGNALTGWEKRQPKREDNSASRMRKMRQKHGETDGDDDGGVVTDGDAGDANVTTRREEIRGEKNPSLRSGDARASTSPRKHAWPGPECIDRQPAIQLMAKLGIRGSLDEHIERMADWHVARSEKRADWNASLRNWLKKEAQNAPPKLTTKPTPDGDLGISAARARSWCFDFLDNGSWPGLGGQPDRPGDDVLPEVRAVWPSVLTEFEAMTQAEINERRLKRWA